MWIVLSAGLALLIAKLPGKRAFDRSKPQAQVAVIPAAAASPPVPASPTSTSVAGQPTPPAADTPEPSSTADTSSDDAIPPGFGVLTVHSGSHASVYLMFKKYGPVEERLVVPCGKRFIGIGLPVRDRIEPTWLAPGKMTDIPCGGSLEVTMNPRRVK
jgi:hypothetical protein